MNRKRKWMLSRGELIGLSLEVASSSDPSQTGLTGRVVDETKNTLKVRREDGRTVIIPKRNCVFRFNVDGEILEIKGRIIAFRPEDRPKKIRMKHLRDDGDARKEGREEAQDQGHRHRR